MMHGKRVSTTISVVLLGLIMVAFLFPFVWMVATSLKPTTKVFSLSPTGSRIAWDNYPSTLNSVPFDRIILNSFIVSLTDAALMVVVSILFAYTFTRLRFRGHGHLFMLFLGTLVLPQEILVIPLYTGIQHMSLVNSYFALIVSFAFGAFGAFLIRQFLMSLPLEFEEAAHVDGCSDWKVLMRILLPLLEAPIMVVGMFTFIDYWSALLWPLVVANDSSLAAIPLGLQIFSGEYDTGWGLLMATVTMTTIPSTPLVVSLQRQLERGVTLGAFGGR